MPTTDESPDPATQIVTYAVAIVVPTELDAGADTDPVTYGGQVILDALSLHGVTVAGVVHHEKPDALFPGGIGNQG